MADKKTGLGMLALIGLGVWYFLIRKPSQGEHSVEVGLTWNPGGNPTFDCGKPRTANITVTNPTEWDWEYEIFLSCDAAFHRVNWPSVAVRAGQTVTISQGITMYDTPCTDQPVSIAVYCPPRGPIIFNEIVDTITLVKAPPGEGLIEVHLAWDVPPPFEAGSIRNAGFIFYNPTPQACKYQITKTYFGVYRGVWGANIGPGESMNFAGAITMPLVPGIYYDAITLDIYELETGKSCTVTFDVEITSDQAGSTSVSALRNSYL
ncbi:hypothetical protein ES703_04120 [subsurface metagenome]